MISSLFNNNEKKCHKYLFLGNPPTIIAFSYILVSCFHKATNICTLAYNSLSQKHIFVNNFRSPSCFHNHRIIYKFETTKYAYNENLATCFAIYLILRDIIHITHFWEFLTFRFILKFICQIRFCFTCTSQIYMLQATNA